MNKSKLISLEKAKKIEFEILKYVKDICEKNNIKYFLAAGTLLGAIRHKGFIPWDDDIDIVLEYPNYIKLLDILRKEKGRYMILEPYENKDYYYFFSKLVDTNTVVYPKDLKKIDNLGVCIDIFPLVNFPNTRLEAEIYVKRLQKILKKYWRHYCLNHYYISDNTFKKIIKAILFCPEHLFYKNNKDKILKIMEEYKDINTEFIGFPLSPYGIKEIMNKKIFESTIDVEFEKETFTAPIGYKEYLSNLYNDYMKLPPEEDRIPPHISETYYK